MRTFNLWAGLLACVMSPAALAALSCDASSVTRVVDASASQFAGLSGDEIINQQITSHYLQSTAPLVLQLKGTFTFKDRVKITQNCLTITSESSATPATLVGKFTQPLHPDHGRWFFRTGTVHHLMLTNLVTRGGGFEVNGSSITISGNRMSDTSPSEASQVVLIMLGNWHGITQGGDDPDDIALLDTTPNRDMVVTNNTLSQAYTGIDAVYLRDSRIAQNLMSNVYQGINARAYVNNVKITGNQGTGLSRMAIEVLAGNNSVKSARARNNTIANNVFVNWYREPKLVYLATPEEQRTEEQKAWLASHDGLLAGISIAKGISNTISGNTLICGTACQVPYEPGKSLGDQQGMGIEAHGVATTVSNNKVTGFYYGVWAGQAQAGDTDAALGATLNARPVTVDRNQINKTVIGVAQQCSGADVAPASQCMRNLVITNNTIDEARDVGIGGDPFWLEHPKGTTAMSLTTLRRLKSLTISGNVITRTYDPARGDNANQVKHRFTGIDLIPLATQSPTQILVKGNRIVLKGTPEVSNGFPFAFTGIRMRLIAQENGLWRDPDLVNGSEPLHHFAGAVVTGNAVSSTSSVYGTGLNASNQTTLAGSLVVYDALQGVIVTQNCFSNLQRDITGSQVGATVGNNVCP